MKRLLLFTFLIVSLVAGAAPAVAADAPKVLVIGFDGMDPVLLQRFREDVLALCERAYEEPLAELFEPMRPVLYVVARRAGALASHAMWVDRWLAVGSDIRKYYSYPRIVGETGGKDFIFAHPSADVEALVVALVAYLWFGNPGIAVIIACAMLLNLLAAALAGIGIAMVRSRRLFEGLDSLNRMIPALPLISALEQRRGDLPAPERPAKPTARPLDMIAFAWSGNSPR